MLRAIPGFVRNLFRERRHMPEPEPAPEPRDSFRIRRARSRSTMPRKWWLRRRARLHMARESRRRNR
jgi:hypothetical protein